MVANKVFEMVLCKDLPAGTKIIDSVWVIKKGAMVHCVGE
jgi:hypothetical protein